MSKRELSFSKPLMNAAGMLGFAPEFNASNAWPYLGAFVTNPISLRPRKAAEAPGVLEYPGGFLIHTGLPNPGFRSALTRYARRWAASSIPIIVHLMADRPAETKEMVELLEGIENVMAVELGFAPLLADDIILLALELSTAELPVILCLPTDQVLRLGPRAVQQGASAISMAGARGTISRDGSIHSGRLYGPSLFPKALDLVYAAARAGIPIIGAGGVFADNQADAMMAAGAIAVQVDAQLWLPSS